MIKTKADLRFYLAEDAKRNRVPKGIKYWLRLFMGAENAHVYRYLKILRHCEYHFNQTGIIHRLACRYYKIRLSQLGLRYNMRIPLNTCGYGLAIYHIAGGGGFC